MFITIFYCYVLLRPIFDLYSEILGAYDQDTRLLQ